MSRPREGSGALLEGATDLENSEPVRTRGTYITRWDRNGSIGSGGGGSGHTTESFNYSYPDGQRVRIQARWRRDFLLTALSWTILHRTAARSGKQAPPS